MTARPPDSGESPGRRRGFTLIELMVVIVLIAILSVMILPEMRGSLEEVQLRSNARKLVTACDIAFSRAVATGQTRRLEFDRSTGRYQVLAGSNGGTAASAQKNEDTPGGTGTVDLRIKVELRRVESAGAGNATRVSPAAGIDAAPAGPIDTGIDFFADGTADASEFVLEDRAGFRLALRINPVTARVRLRELPRL